MKLLINKALKIHDDLLQLKEVQNYLNLKKILDNDENIQLLLKQIKQLQKQLKESVNNDYNSYLRNKKELEKKKKLFFDNPLRICNPALRNGITVLIVRFHLDCQKKFLQHLHRL